MNNLEQGYFLERRELILPVPDTTKEPVSDAVIATGLNNLAALGFIPSKECLEQMKLLSFDQFIAVYRETENALRDIIGAKTSDALVFYKDFPDQVLMKSDVELFLDRITSYIGTILTNEQYVPDKTETERSALIESFGRPLKVLGLGSQEKLEQMYTDRIFSGTSLPLDKLNDTVEFMTKHDGWKDAVKERKIPNKENAANLAYYGVLRDKNLSPEDKLNLMDNMLTTSIDVLRLAALISNQYSMPQTVKTPVTIRRKNKIINTFTKKKMDKPIANDVMLNGKVYFCLNKKSEQNIIRKLLANKKDLYESVWLRPDLFKNLAKAVPMRGKGVPERLETAFDNLCTKQHVNEAGKKIRTPYSFMEGSIEDFKNVFREYFQRPITEAPEKLAGRALKSVRNTAKMFPGVFSRNYMRTVTNALEVLDAFLAPEEQDKKADLRAALIKEIADIYAENCQNVPIKEQIKVSAMMKTLPTLDKRIILESKISTYTTALVTEACKSLTDEEIKTLVNGIALSLDAKLKTFGGLGKVYIDPELRNVAIPSNADRAASKGSVCPMGTRIKGNEDANIIRSFVWWTNGSSAESVGWHRKEVCVDLSASFFDENFNYVGYCAWFNNYTFTHDGERIAVLSGDPTDGGPVDGKGVCEFIDVDKKLMKEHGLRYFILSGHSYWKQPFNTLKNAKFGVMQREGSLDTHEILNKEVDNLNGQIYESSTVEFCNDLTAESLQTIPVAYDVEKNEFIWLDRPIPNAEHYPTCRDKGFAETATKMLEHAVTMPVPEMYSLFLAHALSRGEVTQDISDADLVVLAKANDDLQLKEGARLITANDLSEISAEFLEPVVEEEKEQEIDQDIDSGEQEEGIEH